MILQELVQYYGRQRELPDSEIAPPGWIRRPVDYSLVLGSEGELHSIDTNFVVEKGKLVGNPVLLPAIGKQALKHTNSGKDANLLWDNASFVLGLDDKKGTKLPSFIEAITSWLPIDDNGVAAVLRFLAWAQQNPTELAQKIESSGHGDDFRKRDPTLAFRLLADGPVHVHERPAVRLAYESRLATPASGVRGQCLVTGERDVVLAPNELVIKNVWNSQPSGANVVSFNKPSFVSYGKADRNGESAPIGAATSTAYSVALNHLLASKRNRVQVGDASTVFWADRASRFDGDFTLADLFGESKDDPDRNVKAVAALYDALKAGRLPVEEEDVQFFVLGLAPNAARISVRFWLRAPLSELAPRIRQHFDDLRVVRRYDSDPPNPSLFRLLSGVALLGKLDNVPPRLAGEWMRAILEGQPYPATLLNAAVIRCKAEQEVTYLRAAVIKAWLNRDHRRKTPNDSEPQFKEELDMEQTDPAYRLGCLFAVLERIQQQAQPGINATIRDRYFGAASTNPVTVFTTLLRLKNAHLKKLPDRQVGFFEKRIGEILEPLQDFPRQLTLPQQARFALGYYHQRQDFFKRKEEATEPNNTNAQEA